MPGEIAFATKPQTALARIRVALAQGVPPGVVLADAGYGADMDFQEGLLALALPYVVGRYPAAQLGLATRHGPATSQATAWRTVGWREGAAGASWPRAWLRAVSAPGIATMIAANPGPSCGS